MNLRLLSCVLALLPLCAVGRDREPGAVVLAADAGVSTNLAAAVAGHLGRTFDLEVRTVTLPEREGPQSVPSRRKLKRLLRPDGCCLLVLQSRAPAKTQGHYGLRNPVGRLFLDRLQPPGDDPRTAQRRRYWVLKEAAFVTGRLLGVPECPFPRCCMYPADTPGELDMKPGGLCPPCHGRLLKLHPPAARAP